MDQLRTLYEFVVRQILMSTALQISEPVQIKFTHSSQSYTKFKIDYTHLLSNIRGTETNDSCWPNKDVTQSNIVKLWYDSQPLCYSFRSRAPSTFTQSMSSVFHIYLVISTSRYQFRASNHCDRDRERLTEKWSNKISRSRIVLRKTAKSENPNQKQNWFAENIANGRRGREKVKQIVCGVERAVGRLSNSSPN